MAAPLNIVIVEDHDALRAVTGTLLREQGYKVTEVASAEELLEASIDAHVDVFILDVNLPGENGFSLAQRLRAVQPQIGIIMTTARDEPRDKLTGYDSGADIYLAKPVDPSELIGAVRSLARRLRTPVYAPTPSSTACAALDTQRRRLSSGGRTAILTGSEVSILSTLIRAPNRFTPYWQLLELLSLQQDQRGKSSLEVRMVRLREKIMSLGYPRSCIRSVRSSGYELGIDVEIR